MRFSIRMLLLFPILLFLIACSSQPPASDEDSGNGAVANELNKFGEDQFDNNGQASGNVAEETQKESADLDQSDKEVENELALDDKGASDVPEDLKDFDQPQQAAQTAPPAPAPAPEATAPAPAPEIPSAEASSAPAVRVTDLQYLAKKAGGTIQVKTSEPAQYTTRRNESENQFIIEIQNATLPDRLKRPYITKEFSGQVAAINAYQDAGSKTARIVVQLRDNVEPVVEQSGDAILIKPNVPAAVAQTDGSTTPPADQSQLEPAVDEAAADADESKQEITSFEDYLMGHNRFYGRKINIEAENEDIRNVFDLIARESGANIVLDQAVTGTITVKLREVPWDQAMIVVMKSKGLGYVREGNVLRIAPLDTLKHEAEMASSLIESKQKSDPLRVKVVPISFAQVDDVVKHAEKFLTPRGKVVGDNRSSSVVITDTPENIDRIVKLIKTLDIVPEQVLIEGKIVEAQENLQRRIGVQWSFSGQTVPTGNNSLGGQINLTPSGNLGSGMPLNPNSNSGNFGFTWGTLDYIGSLSANLALFEQEDLAKVISSPRILAMNREHASMLQEFQLPIAVTTVTNNISQTTTTYMPAQIKLDVVPQITSDGSVIMEMDVKRESFGAISDAGRPKNTREAKTKILVKSGQTAVIGGIYDNEEVNSDSGLPGLRKIPILGWIFKTHQKTKDRNELMIFLTPRILARADAQATNGGTAQ